MSSTKDARVAVRMTSDAEAVIRAAATSEGITMTDFIVQASVARATDALADRHAFGLDDEHWAAFQSILDRPARRNDRLAELFDGPSIFDADQ